MKKRCFLMWVMMAASAGSAGYVPYKELFGCSIDYV